MRKRWPRGTRGLGKHINKNRWRRWTIKRSVESIFEDFWDHGRRFKLWRLDRKERGVTISMHRMEKSPGCCQCSIARGW